MKYDGFFVLGILLSLYGLTNVSRSIFYGTLRAVDHYVLFGVYRSIQQYKGLILEIPNTRAASLGHNSSIVHRSVLCENCSSFAVNKTSPTEAPRNNLILPTSVILATSSPIMRSVSNGTQVRTPGNVATNNGKRSRNKKRYSTVRRKPYTGYQRQTPNYHRRQGTGPPEFVHCQLDDGGLANKIFGVVSCYVIASLLNATIECMYLLSSSPVQFLTQILECTLLSLTYQTTQCNTLSIIRIEHDLHFHKRINASPSNRESYRT